MYIHLDKQNHVNTECQFNRELYKIMKIFSFALLALIYIYHLYATRWDKIKQICSLHCLKIVLFYQNNEIQFLYKSVQLSKLNIGFFLTKQRGFMFIFSVVVLLHSNISRAMTSHNHGTPLKQTIKEKSPIQSILF